MKETIEAWCVVYGSSRSIWNTESDARQQALLVNGTVVRLTGEMPNVPIKYSVELWGNEWKPDKFGDTTFSQQVHGIDGLWATEKVTRCPIKYRITVEELSE